MNMKHVLLVCAIVGGVACSKAKADETPAAAVAAVTSPGVSKEAAVMIAQTHRDSCAATREVRVEMAQDKARAYLAFIQTAKTPSSRTPTQRAFKDRLPDSGAWAQWPLSSYPDGFGSVDSCRAEDAKVGLDTTPALGDVPGMVKLLKWHA